MSIKQQKALKALKEATERRRIRERLSFHRWTLRHLFNGLFNVASFALLVNYFTLEGKQMLVFVWMLLWYVYIFSRRISRYVN